MVNSVSAQTIEFLYSALLGLGLGVLFDIMRVLRTYIPKSRTITAVLDVLFWIIAIIALLAFVMTESKGRMRWYVLFGAFSGGFVYIAAFSMIVYKVLCSLVRVIKKVLYFVTRPVYLLLRGTWRVGKRTEIKIEKGIAKAHRQKREERRKRGG